MIIPKLINSPYFDRLEAFPTVVGNIDRLVFVIKKPLGYSFKVIDMRGDLPLSDKILAYICQNDDFGIPHKDVIGPFYVGALQTAEVKYPEWSTTKEFIDIMDYEFMRRRSFSVKISNDGMPETIEGRAVDLTEFYYLFIDEHHSKDVLPTQPANRAMG